MSEKPHFLDLNETEYRDQTMAVYQNRQEKSYSTEYHTDAGKYGFFVKR